MSNVIHFDRRWKRPRANVPEVYQVALDQAQIRAAAMARYKEAIAGMFDAYGIDAVMNQNGLMEWAHALMLPDNHKSPDCQGESV